ncbi:hypothetical protein Vafri_15714 [Volvox africanus]|nr:hypothetical protein Vafri_15714 [Volvox africanus]
MSQQSGFEAEASAASPLRHQSTAAPWPSMPQGQGLEPGRQQQPRQPSPQSAASEDGAVLSPSPLTLQSPALLTTTQKQQQQRNGEGQPQEHCQQEEEQEEQEEQDEEDSSPVIKPDSAATKTEPLLLSPPMLLPAPLLSPSRPLPPALTDATPPRPRSNGPRRLNGNSSRAVRSQFPLLQLTNLDQLPGPVRVTVSGGGSTRSAAEGGSRRGGGRSGGGGRRGSDGGGISDDDEDDSTAGRGSQGGGSKGVGGGGSVQGIFHVKPYLEGRKCIDHGGEMVSRSAFERAGGSMMAKWYRSIKVLPEGISLGKWLVSNGLPVLKGNPRRSKKNNTLTDGEGA